jgi:hypothetical protein
MSDQQVIADCFEIVALCGEFTDAAMVRDFDRFASAFTEDGAWRIPYWIAEFVNREETRSGIERGQATRDYFIQNAHAGTIQLAGDMASGRADISEFGRFRYIPDGWKFSERVYEIKWLDVTALADAAADLSDSCRLSLADSGEVEGL